MLERAWGFESLRPHTQQVSAGVRRLAAGLAKVSPSSRFSGVDTPEAPSSSSSSPAEIGSCLVAGGPVAGAESVAEGVA